MSDFNNPWTHQPTNEWNKGNENYDRWFISGEDASDDTKKIDISKPDEIRIYSRADIVIVVDPGHGGTDGNTGAVYYSAYKHKIQGSDGKAEIDATTGKEKIVTTNPENLPSYVRDEVNKKPATWKWLVQRIADNSKSEKELVWKVSQSLKSILSNAGYTTYVSRTNKDIEGLEDRSLRNKFANEKGAHYFISVHADGSYAFWVSGSHVIYRKSNDNKYNERQRTFAADVFRHYNVVAKKNSPRRDREGLQVLSTQNKSLRKSIVELGFVTNADDYEKMTSNIDLMAKQIAQGVEHNISKVYYTEERGDLLGYYYNGKVYRTRELAYEQYNLRNGLYNPPTPMNAEIRRKPFAHYEKKRNYLTPTIT